MDGKIKPRRELITAFYPSHRIYKTLVALSKITGESKSSICCMIITEYVNRMPPNEQKKCLDIYEAILKEHELYK